MFPVGESGETCLRVSSLRIFMWQETSERELMSANASPPNTGAV